MERLMERWKTTGLFSDLNNQKIIFVEPKHGDQFEEMLREYNEVINRGHGALLFGVYRGKVGSFPAKLTWPDVLQKQISEGIDFSNASARAVIAVGIPYPSFKDVQVVLKRQYNDKHTRERRMVNGSEWYDIQAFRGTSYRRCGEAVLTDDRCSL